MCQNRWAVGLGPGRSPAVDKDPEGHCDSDRIGAMPPAGHAGARGPRFNGRRRRPILKSDACAESALACRAPSSYARGARPSERSLCPSPSPSKRPHQRRLYRLLMCADPGKGEQLKQLTAGLAAVRFGAEVGYACATAGSRPWGRRRGRGSA